jgi:hypothetical protein
MEIDQDIDKIGEERTKKNGEAEERKIITITPCLLHNAYKRCQWRRHVPMWKSTFFPTPAHGANTTF